MALKLSHLSGLFRRRAIRRLPQSPCAPAHRCVFHMGNSPLWGILGNVKTSSFSGFVIGFLVSG